MSIKITWREPSDTNITSVRISKSTDKYGTYSTLITIDATSDGAAKTSANTWVTYYIDSAGNLTDWYKIEFYDGTNTVWSEFSDPITGRQEIKMCTVDDVKQIVDTIGRWTDDEIFDAIEVVESDMEPEMGIPIMSIYSVIGKIDTTLQDTYYVGEENIHRIDRVFYGTTTKHEYFLDDGYKSNRKYGMIRLLPVASGGPELTTTDEVEIRYVPKIFNRVAVYRTAVHLLEKIDYASRGSTSKELEVAMIRLENSERRLQNRFGFGLSSDYTNYDFHYGVGGKKRIIQDHSRNKFLGSYGWD